MTDMSVETITKEVQSQGYSHSIVNEIIRVIDAIEKNESKRISRKEDKEILSAMVEAYARIRSAQIEKA